MFFAHTPSMIRWIVFLIKKKQNILRDIFKCIKTEVVSKKTELIIEWNVNFIQNSPLGIPASFPLGDAPLKLQATTLYFSNLILEIDFFESMKKRHMNLDYVSIKDVALSPSCLVPGEDIGLSWKSVFKICVYFDSNADYLASVVNSPLLYSLRRSVFLGIS